MHPHLATSQISNKVIKIPNQIILSRSSKSAEGLKSQTNKITLSPNSNQKTLPQTKCSICVKELGISNTPKCSEHKYCKTCLNVPNSLYKKITCENCRNYFEALSKPPSKGTIRCVSCTIYPNTPKFCNDHFYCIKCLEFFKLADLSCFFIIGNCKICFDYIKYGIQSNTTRAKTPEIKFKAQLITNPNPGTIYSFGSKVEEIKLKNNELYAQGSQSSRDYVSDFMNPKEKQNISYSQVQNKYSKTNERPTNNKNLGNNYVSNITINKSQEIRNLAKNIIRSTEQPQLKFKIIDKNSENNQDRVKNSMNLTPKTTRNETRTISDKSRSTTPDFSKTQNEPNKQKSQRSISPLNLKLQVNGRLMGQEKKKFIGEMIIHKKNSIPNPRTEYLASQHNSLANLNPTCSVCKKEEKVKGFLCNHNLCLKCTVKTGITQINDFFDLYRSENGAAYFQFFYICPVEACSQCINIPCLLIMKHLAEFIDSKNNGFEKYSSYRNWSYDDWSQWISYFDGIGFDDR